MHYISSVNRTEFFSAALAAPKGRSRTILPLERLSALWPAELKGGRIGALLHPASILPDLTHTVDLLFREEKLFRLSTLFGPQHGILGETQDNMVEWEGGRDGRTGLPLYSLYGEHREPTSEMLKGLDAILVDLQDVGARYYTYIWSLWLAMRACEREGVAVVVCDRPNPIGNSIEGPVLEPEYASFVGLHPIPIRHGQTIGALAQRFQREQFPKLQLFVLPMENYDPACWFDETGLPWVAPSPNMPTLDTATVYPGGCLFEATNISEGRGTTRPFELVGAPWMDAQKLCRFLTEQELPGVRFRESHFAPTFHKYGPGEPVVAGWRDAAFEQYRGEVCHGVQIHVTDRHRFLPYVTACEILRYAFHTHPEQFRWRPAEVGYEYDFVHLGIDLLFGSSTARKEAVEGRSL